MLNGGFCYSLTERKTTLRSADILLVSRQLACTAQWRLFQIIAVKPCQYLISTSIEPTRTVSKIHGGWCHRTVIMLTRYRCGRNWKERLIKFVLSDIVCMSYLLAPKKKTVGIVQCGFADTIPSGNPASFVHCVTDCRNYQLVCYRAFTRSWRKFRTRPACQHRQFVFVDVYGAIVVFTSHDEASGLCSVHRTSQVNWIYGLWRSG